MKWRASLLYLLVLLLVGGYFYYFEVVQRDKKQVEEKESKRVLQLQPDSITALEIDARDKAPVELRKEPEWVVVQPIRTEADKAAAQDVIGTLANLESKREVSASAQDLKPFGIDRPALKVRFQAGTEWQELLVGDKNPAGDAYYAAVSGRGSVFLISPTVWAALNKGLAEVRRKELFTLKPDEVRSLSAEWRDGGGFSLVMLDGRWTAPEKPDLKIKKRKVDSLLDQIRWLRASSFLQEGPNDLAKFGLQPPQVKIRIQSNGEKSAELLLSSSEDDKKAIALSSELNSIAQVDAALLKDIPTSVEGFEDRSLIGFSREMVKKISWTLGGNSGQAVQTEPGKWTESSGAAKTATKEPWRIQSLLWNLFEAEYLAELDPVPPLPEKVNGRLELSDGNNTLAVLSWEKLPEGDAATVTVWLERQGKLRALTVGAKALNAIERDLEAPGNNQA